MYPLKKNMLTDDEKIKKIQKSFEDIMTTLWLDLEDDSLKRTPYRVAKMYVKEIFKGLNEKNKPEMRSFENKYHYDEMVTVKDIKVHTACEHHLVPIVWKAYVAYIPNKKVVGLSKINRLVNYHCRRPQVQERLTEAIYQDLKKELNTENIAVYIEAKHYCVILRWIKDINSSTTTTKMGWVFMEDNNIARQEFLQIINK